MSGPERTSEDRRNRRRAAALIVGAVLIVATVLGAGVLAGGTSRQHVTGVRPLAVRNASWHKASIPEGVERIDSMACSTSTTCVATGFSASTSVVMRSTDAGRTWSAVEAPTIPTAPPALGGAASARSSVGCIGDTCVVVLHSIRWGAGGGTPSVGLVLRSTNSGLTWASVPMPVSPDGVGQIEGPVSCVAAVAKCYVVGVELVYPDGNTNCQLSGCPSNAVASLLAVPTDPADPSTVVASVDYEYLGGSTRSAVIGPANIDVAFAGCRPAAAGAVECAVARGAALAHLDALTWVIPRTGPVTTIATDPIGVEGNFSVATIPPGVPTSIPIDLVRLPTGSVVSTRMGSATPCPYLPACSLGETWMGHTLVQNECWPTTRTGQPPGCVFLRSDNSGRTWKAIVTTRMQRDGLGVTLHGTSARSAVVADIWYGTFLAGTVRSFVAEPVSTTTPTALGFGGFGGRIGCTAGMTWLAGDTYSGAGVPVRGVLFTLSGCGI